MGEERPRLRVQITFCLSEYMAGLLHGRGQECGANTGLPGVLGDQMGPYGDKSMLLSFNGWNVLIEICSNCS